LSANCSNTTNTANILYHPLSALFVSAATSGTCVRALLPLTQHIPSPNTTAYLSHALLMFAPNETLASKVQQTLESPNDSQGSPSAKTEKCTSQTATSPWFRSPSYWNSLSKVYLTGTALREFERRVSKAAQRVWTPHLSTNPSSGPGTKTLKQFARHGGPDLTHLRAVSTGRVPDRVRTDRVLW
jgi:hypothetical protein